MDLRTHAWMLISVQHDRQQKNTDGVFTNRCKCILMLPLFIINILKSFLKCYLYKKSILCRYSIYKLLSHLTYNKEYNGITQGLAAVLSWLFNVIYILSQRELL